MTIYSFCDFLRCRRATLARRLWNALEWAFRSQMNFETVERLASNLRCDLQYRMDIDPSSGWHSTKFVANFGGFHPPGETRTIHRIHSGDRVRSDMIILLLREITVRQIPGCMAELGVHRGNSARLLHTYCPERKLFLFDTYAGFSDLDLAAESLDVNFNSKQQFTDTNLEIVLQTIAPVNTNVVPIVGWFPASATPEAISSDFAFVHLDADLEAPIAAGLEFFWPRLNSGGFIVIHDYNAWPGARLAVDRFREVHGPVAVPMPDKSGSIVLAKN